MGLKILRSAVGSMPSWGIIEELQKKGVEVVGMDSNPLSFGLYKLKKGYVVPTGDSPLFIEKILKIIEIEKPDAILSGPEQEIISLSKNKDLIEKKGVKLLCPDYPSVRIATNKKRISEFFNEKDIPCPKTYSLKNISFPCIVKPSEGSGGSNVFKVERREDLPYFLKKIKEPIIQEFVEGEEYTVDILASQKSEVIALVPRLRINTESGISVKGKTIFNKEIEGYCRKIVKELKIIGPCCIQCIKDKNNGLKFLEINLRFGGGSILSMNADESILENFLKMVKGETPSKSKGYKKNLCMLRYYSEVFITEKNFNESNNI
jgi:carbamoyl-phosphate synthase large subunit